MSARHRPPATPLCFVSPHLDDAVLSSAQTILQHDDAHVLTVFTDAPPVTRTDGWNHATTGREFAPDTQAVRRTEDLAAVASMGAIPHWLGLHEAEYRDAVPSDPDPSDADPSDLVTQIAAAIAAFVRDHPFDTIVAPLGLRHPDHVAVSDACLRLAMSEPLRWRIALDQPYGTTFPELVDERLSRARSHGFTLTELPPTPVDERAKHEAVSHYASQLDAVRGEHPELDRAVASDERWWQLTTTPGAAPIGEALHLQSS